MTTTNKILIGVGAIALAYYFYTKRNKGGITSTKLSQETIDCLRSKLIVANGKITEEQFNNLVANNFSESSVRSLVESLSKVAHPNADIKALKNSAASEIYSLLKNCKDGQTPSTPKLGGDVDKKYEACLKEFESLAMPHVTPRFNFKQYKEDYINNCMKKSQQKPSTPKKDNDANFSNLTSMGGGRTCVHLFCPCGCKNINGRGHCTPPQLCPK